MPDTLKQARMIVTQHTDPKITCRTCHGSFIAGQWVFSNENQTMEWHRDCSTVEYRNLFDAALEEQGVV